MRDTDQQWTDLAVKATQFLLPSKIPYVSQKLELTNNDSDIKEFGSCPSYVLSTWYKLELSGNLNWGNASIRQPVGKTDVEGPAHLGQCHFGAGGAGLLKKTGWANHKEQARKQRFSVAQCLSPGSCLEFHPWLPSGMTCDPNKLFSLQVALGHSNRVHTKTCPQSKAYFAKAYGHVAHAKSGFLQEIWVLTMYWILWTW